MLADNVLAGLREVGMVGGILPVERLQDIGSDIADLKQAGVIDPELYDAYLKNWKFSVPDSLPEARSIVIVATPVPKIRLHFIHNGNDLPIFVPPTYSDAAEIAERAVHAMTQALAPTEVRFVRMYPALRTLATRTGIARYGRNNIIYVPGHGSFVRLTAFFTDVDLGSDMWQDRKMLDRCGKCRSCVRACPVSAITEDRFVMYAERCITYHNEKPSEVPFPKGFKTEWHNAIIGCMRCQDACPEDKEVKDWTVDGETFGEEDTRHLLQGDLSGVGAHGIERRLARYGLELSTFPRNLQVLIGR